MTQILEQIYSKDERHLLAVGDESRGVVVISTGFDPACRTSPHPPRDLHLNTASEKLLKECVRVLRVGGWMFVYGLPEELPHWAQRLSTLAPSEGESRDPTR